MIQGSHSCWKKKSLTKSWGISMIKLWKTKAAMVMNEKLWEIITDLWMSQYYLCQPLLMEIFGEKDLGFYCIIVPFKGMKSRFLKEECEQCKVHA